MTKIRKCIAWSFFVIMFWGSFEPGFFGPFNRSNLSSYIHGKMITILCILLYVIGICIICYRNSKIKVENKIKLREREVLKYLDMKIPKQAEYEQLKQNAQNIYIRTWNDFSYLKIYLVSDLLGNVLYKFREMDKATGYGIYDPYDNELGEIHPNFTLLVSFFPSYRVILNNGAWFDISKNEQILMNNYEFENLPFKIFGDYFGFDLAIVSSVNDAMLASVDNTMADGLAHSGNSDITVYDNRYLLEITCSIFCTILAIENTTNRD